MKKHRSRFLSGLLVVAMVAALAIPAAAEMVQLSATTGVTIYVDDQKVDPRNAQGDPVDALLTGGTTYLPIRALGDALGKDIGWDESTTTAYVSGYEADPKAAEYLEEYFDIAPLSGNVSRASFDAALEAIGGSATEGTGDLTVAQAVVAAVKAAGMEALALTYTDDNDAKATERIAAYGLPAMSEDVAAYVAAALDCDLAYATFDFDAALDAETATTLLMNAVNISGQGRRYLGNTTDPDIAAKMRAAFDTFYDFSTLNDTTVQQLWDIGEAIVDAGATTGFGLKSEDYESRFLPKYTVQYSHDSIDNAVQLVVLLASEGIEAKVAFEPKVSIYQWEDHLNSGMEYDLQLEFASVEDKEAFHDIIVPYVTRNLEGNTHSQIIDPYITPAYNSETEVEGYEAIYDNIISCGKYSLHPFSLPDRVSAVSATVDGIVDEYNAGLAEGETPIETEVLPLWCNPAFYTYLEDIAG